MLPRYTIGQILLATVAIGCGLAVARLPQGSASDVVLVATGMLLVRSMVGRLRALFVARQRLDLPDRPSATLFLLLLTTTAGALAAGLILRFCAAGGWITFSDDPFYHIFLWELSTLSLMLVLLSMFIAVGLGEPGWKRNEHPSRRTKWFTLFAVLCLPIALVAYWCNGLLIWLLVYYALSGVDVGYAYGLLPPQPLNFARGAQYYVFGASLGLPLALLHLAVISACVSKWRDPRWPNALVLALVGLLLTELAYISWLAGPGLRALSPHYVEVLALPSWQPGIMAVAMIVLISAWLAFRLAAHPPEEYLTRARHIAPQPASDLLFHERFAGALMVGLAAVSCIVHRYLGLQRVPFTSTIELVAYDATRPESLTMFATAFGAFGLAWKRRRLQQCIPTLPHVDVTQFAALAFAIGTGMILGGIMIAAFAFGLLLVAVGSVG